MTNEIPDYGERVLVAVRSYWDVRRTQAERSRELGVSLQTLDIDVVPRLTDENLERLAAALRELGARLRVGGMTDEEARQLGDR